MAEIKTEVFSVKNIDCPSCAAKIENGLKALDGVNDAVFDFASLTLHVKARDLTRIVEEVRKIEPGVELAPRSEMTTRPEPDEGPGDFRLKKELIILALAAVLFCIQLFFEDWFHQNSFLLLEIAIVVAAYLIAGGNVLLGALKTIRKGRLFDENVLMVIATGGALAIHAFSEAVGVMIFYKVGELLQNLAVSRSRRSIQALLAAKPDKAVVKTADGYREVAPESVAVGDVLLIKPGEKVPLDGEIIAGNSQVDSSALTGEFVPLSARPGDTVLAGQINKSGALTVRVSRPFSESSIAKVMDLVENATARKAKTEKFITTFARYYTPAVVMIAAGIAFIPPLISEASFQTWIYRALVLLVISCPCALVVSIPLGYFGGIGKASRNGILVKGSNFIDALAAVKTVVFDKTGTLSRGVFKVKEIVNLNGYSKSQLLEFAAAAELQSNHPIATSIINAFTKEGHELNPALLSDHTDISGQGVSARYGEHAVLVGNDSLLHSKSIDHSRCEFSGTVSHVAVDGSYAGYITIDDELKPDAASALKILRQQGVEQIVMLTGDNARAAEAAASRLGLDGIYADLLPEDKVSIFEKLAGQSRNDGKIAFVGDGINDAPVLARADVGVAMGALGSDAAVETADVVLMNDSPMKMAEAVSIARQTRRIVWQNIVLAFAVKGIFILFGTMGMATMWEAVFADMGTALLAVANSTRIIGKNT
ncbi:Lead, cadmium, zinc and mercury transporting ATPase (EC (EC; Copper-translocating P-type ATPase (EC [Olavius algarvensis Delta 1 endosymbiont]|nr:Lead, cadmium, zinc and mercury transporting ATPase (EC (EC; Copper-translocating P-type ATPase (EC [Olavius algarvensis Delta 1 endosymbiont]